MRSRRVPFRKIFFIQDHEWIHVKIWSFVWISRSILMLFCLGIVSHNYSTAKSQIWMTRHSLLANNTKILISNLTIKCENFVIFRPDFCPFPQSGLVEFSEWNTIERFWNNLEFIIIYQQYHSTTFPFLEAIPRCNVVNEGN